MNDHMVGGTDVPRPAGRPSRGRRKPATKRQAQAVGLAEVIGIRPAAREAGIPESTLRTWREHPDLAQLRAEKKEDVAADVWAMFQKGVRRTGELLETTDDLQKVATATGILYDKFALMSGHATERTESRELLDGFEDHEKEALESWLHDMAKQRADAPSS